MKNTIREALINRHFLTIRGGYRRLLSIGISALLFLSTFLTVIPLTGTDVYAAASKAIVIVNDGVASNITGAQANSVYFGNYYQTNNTNKEPIKWRVLQNNTTDKTLFLLSDQNLDCKQYNESYTSVTWETCSLRKWLNGLEGYTDNNFIKSAFTSGEQGVLVTTVNTNPIYSEYTSGGTDTNDKVFLLSVPEAQNNSYGLNDDSRKSLNTAYAITQGAYEISGYGNWWLRSPGNNDNYAAVVNNGGSVNTGGGNVNHRNVAVRPALNINHSSIILTSAAEGGKISGTTGADSLNPVDNTTSVTEWKLTVHDTGRDGAGKFTPKRTDHNALEPRKQLTISYSGAVTGSDKEFVSAIITDADDTILYYGHIASTQSSASGTATINIPNDARITSTCKLYVFQEQCNGDKKTDHSSKLHDLTDPATKQTPTADDFDVTLPTDLVYDGNAKTATAAVKSGITGMGTVTVNYYKDGTKLTGVPKDIGTYTVKLDVAEGDDYTSATDITKDAWEFTITDSAVPVTDVTVSPKEIELKPGASKTLTKTIAPDNATNKGVTWSSSKESVATVDNNGKVTAVDEGEATITVTTEDGKFTDSCKVTVRKDAPVVETCNISFDANGGKGEMDDQTVDKGVKTQLNKNRFTRDGYSFDSWNTDPDGDGSSCDDKDYITVEKDTTLYAQWKKGKPKHDDDEETEEPSKPAVVNPDTVEGFFAVSGQPVPGVAMGKMAQGPAAQAVFNATRPAGFLQAFTFNMAVNGKVDYTLKNGVLTIIIPKEFQKAGRTFAIMALDKNGRAWVYADTDTNPNTVTATINVEGYAFALIYKD